MTTRRTFLGWLKIVGAAMVALPLGYISVFRRAHKKAILVTGDTFVEALAELATPQDPASIRLLIDSALQYNNSYFPPMPDEIEERVKTTIVRAELAYWQSGSPVVDEKTIADTYNLIVARLGLPELALTSSLQLRLLRMQQAISWPRLMDFKRLNEAGSSMMSPLQAAVVVKGLIVSKRGVPWYWVPPTEWDMTRYEEGLRTLREARKRLGKFDNDNQRKTDVLKAQLANNPKFRDVLSTQFRHGLGIPYNPFPVFSSLDSAEQMNLISEAFAQLRLG